MAFDDLLRELLAASDDAARAEVAGRLGQVPDALPLICQRIVSTDRAARWRSTPTATGSPRRSPRPLEGFGDYASDATSGSEGMERLPDARRVEDKLTVGT